MAFVFHEYSSIENSYQTAYLDKIRESIALGYINDDFVVTEKVHGANFSFITDGMDIRIGKRTCLIDNKDDFYGAPGVLDRYKNAVEKVWSKIAEMPSDKMLAYIQVYGEIYGGQYPHPDVEKVKNTKLVQKGIWYCPENDFYGFDIERVYDDGTREYVNQDTMYNILTECGIPAARPLFRSSFEDCLKYPNAFQTTIPAIKGLPEIENNICEGVVIKPVWDQRLANGARPLVKNKNERFKEKCHGPKKTREAEVLPDEVQELLEILLEYVCDNRLCNVLSHDTYDIPKDFGRLIKDFTGDVMEDFVKDNHARWDLMEKADQKKLTKRMTSEASALIKKHYYIIS